MRGMVEVRAPALGDGVEKMLLVSWGAQAGGRVAAEEVLFEVETDKAVFEVEAEVSGTLVEILVEAGESVAPGTVLARIAVD